MSTVLTFDTLAYVKRLRDADVPEKQAEAQAEALRVVLDAAPSDHSKTQAQDTARAVEALDTKTERALAKTEQAIALLRKEMESRFTLLQWMLGFLLAGVLLLILRAFF